MKTMHPIAFIFVIVSPKVGFHKCALWCEYASDRSVACDKVRQRHTNMLVYSSMPVYDKNSLGWDYFVRFIGCEDGEIINGLRFRKGDPFWVCVELGRDKEAEIESYLSEFAVLVHYESNSKEYVALLDWLDTDVDSVSGNVKKYLPNGVRVYAIFSGNLPSSLRREFMAANEGKEHLPLGGMEFIRQCVLKAEREIDWAIIRYNEARCSEWDKSIYDNHDCASCEECDEVSTCPACEQN